MRFLMSKFYQNELVQIYSNHGDWYPSPSNFNYFWGFGSLALGVLVSQIITGVLLAMHYNANIHLSFNDLEHIMRDVVNGYGLRYMHANGASMFFIVVYLHIARGLFYGSYIYPRITLWFSGIILFFLMMAAGFMGYVLPWGQMSFWGATVITNFFSAIPVVGGSVVEWLWGGFSVDQPTLNRFFSLHFLIPFLIFAVAALHIVLLHEHGSNNPLGINEKLKKVSFIVYYGIKDLFGIVIFAIFFGYFLVNSPNALGHPDNYIEAQPLVTPAHIVPEWYFLPYYAILRTVPDKLGGVILMLASIFIALLLPFFDTSDTRSGIFKPFHFLSFFSFMFIAGILGWLGQEVVEYPFINFAEIISVLYFSYFGLHFLYKVDYER
jgi:ubiquinol-cytochrome c reductase cytochrome b/c1 subunit